MGQPLSDEEVRFFLDSGYLIVHRKLAEAERAKLSDSMDALTWSGKTRDSQDFHYAAGHTTGTPTLHRIDYVIDKSDECKALLGHPFVLAATEQLIGPDFIPTWDAMVVKLPHEGIAVRWHQDAAIACAGTEPIFNVDFYLDEATHDTCVWIVPGSHRWPAERVAVWIKEHSENRSRADFENSGAVPALMQPGDILFHNIKAVHGSPTNETSASRRVIYYEFRPAHVEIELGPHIPAYIPKKQKVLQACINKRKLTTYVPESENPFEYNPPAPFNRTRLAAAAELETYRVPHEDYWRPESWTPRLSLDINLVSCCRVSPDGSLVVFAVTRHIIEDETSEQRTQIWLNRASGGEAIPLTSGSVSSTNPQWSPDSRRIAFVSRRADTHTLFAIRVDGGEPEPLAESKSSFTDYAWSPDGLWIAFTSSEPVNEEKEKRNKAKDDWRFEDEELAYCRLSVMPFCKDLAGNREPVLLSPAGMQVTGFHWSPDSKEIAFEHMPHPKADYWTSSAISKVDAASGVVASVFSGDRAAFNPVYSRDGKAIAVSLTCGAPRWAYATRLHLITTSSGEPTAMQQTDEASPAILGWSNTDSSLVLAEQRGLTTAIYSADRETGSVGAEYAPADNQALTEVSLNAEGTYLGLIMQRPDAPPEAYVCKYGSANPVRVSTANTELVMPPIGRTEPLHWKSPDGTEVEGLLTYPVNYKAGTRVPTLLMIHGGPAGVFVKSCIANPGVYPTASFASSGYAVLRCNPRGSSGYGAAFRAGNLKDWGGGDYQDLMSGIDYLIDAEIADPDRLGVMGWSYGGFMTSWIITQTNRFKAASVGAGVTNLMSFNGTSDIPSFVPDYLEAEYWNDLDIYKSHSAMFQIGAARTPTLIVHGEADVRVPISQGYELYNALKRQGVETRMLVLPRQPHGPNEPKLMLKNLQANLEWFLKRV